MMMNVDVVVKIDDETVKISSELQNSLVSLVTGYMKAKLGVSKAFNPKATKVGRVEANLAQPKNWRSAQELEIFFRRVFELNQQQKTPSDMLVILKPEFPDYSIEEMQRKIYGRAAYVQYRELKNHVDNSVDGR